MSQNAITIHNLSKLYQIGASKTSSGMKKASYRTLQESITNTFARIAKNLFKKKESSNSKQSETSFWALRDVSFEVKHGEVIGIIGRNGAGKSTLLKILSRITEPTAGYADVHGRIGSLLEVGSGFHPELTGKENILLNGAVIGMKSNEIKKKFDEIVEFSEVGKFIDTPVKHYSSGMYTKLAFSVAAHLEPEILIIDEVLSVGDAEFQKKCLGKIKNISTKEGRTVLFVSHNMTAIQNLCSKAVLLDQGVVQNIGSVQQVVNEYLSKNMKDNHERIWDKIENAPGNDLVKIKSIKLVPQYTDNKNLIDVRTPLNIWFKFWSLKDNQELNLSIHLFNLKGDCILNVISKVKYLSQGIAEGLLKIPGNLLNDDSYYISLRIVKDRSKTIFKLDEVLSFTVDDYRSNSLWYGKWEGAVRPTFLEFSLNQVFGD